MIHVLAEDAMMVFRHDKPAIATTDKERKEQPLGIVSGELAEILLR